MRRLVIGALVAAAALTGCTCSSPAPSAEVPAAAPAAEVATPAPAPGGKNRVVQLADPSVGERFVAKVQGQAAPAITVDPQTARWAREQDAIAHALIQRGEAAQARAIFEKIIARTPAGSPQHEGAKRALEQAQH